MSEPIQKGEDRPQVLDSALNDAEAALRVPAETLQKNSETLAQPPADARSSVGAAALSADHTQKASSQQPLSPAFAKTLSPNPVSANAVTDVSRAVAESQSHVPDLDNDTIAAVCLHGEATKNRRSTPCCRCPTLASSQPLPRQEQTRMRFCTDDAMEEEQRAQAQAARYQERQQQQSAGRGGGGAGSFFSGLLNSDSRESSAPHDAIV